MSLVGPRPERPVFVETLKEKIPYYDIRHDVRPGITGWAQVCYPYGSSEEDALRKLEYDLYYMKHMSPALDLLVIFKTVKIVLFAKGGR
jgi:lipopolysaccharide/colanic/teichoic acid biosynthesis glycosyltransferase